MKNRIKSSIGKINKRTKMFNVTWKEIYTNRKGTLFYATLMFLFCLMMASMFDPTLFEGFVLMESSHSVNTKSVGPSTTIPDSLSCPW